MSDIKFNLAFTAEVDKYIADCQKKKEKPTVKGFATRIGTDQHAIWAWALKKTKDKDGKLTETLARPSFHEAVTKLDKIEKEDKKDKLTPQQELFCQLYATDREFFGNGVQSYIEAYDVKLSKPGAYNSARSSAYDNLTKPHILKRIDELLEINGLNNQAVDKELAFVIMQKADLSAKTAAIREYNKLKSRITEHHDHTTKGQPILGGSSNAIHGNNSHS